MSEQEVKTFVENSGLPANAHAKKLAKEKAKKAKLPKQEIVFYSINGDKIIQIKAKANGSHSSYVGSVKKHNAQFKSMKAGWVKEGSWVDPHELEQKLSEAVASLQAKAS